MAEGEFKNMPENPTRTAQHCAQCTAHGEIAPLKGHKRKCPFKECTCVHCVLVNNKREIMAKQVKLKRLQEKNHGLRKGRRSRVGIKSISTSSPNKEVIEEVSPETRESQFVYLNHNVIPQELPDIQQCQEEAWKAVCGSDPLDDRLKCSTTDQWYPVSPMRFTHINPLQLQPTTSFFQPRSPPITMATNFLPSNGPDVDMLSLNHIQTQPVYYTPPGYAVSLAQANEFPPLSNDINFLPLEVLPTNGYPRSIDAAQTLLTLHTGED